MKKSRKILSWVLAFCLTLICFSVADFTVSANVRAIENTDIISGETYRIYNIGSGKYLNVHDGTNSDAVNVYQKAGNNSIDQDFIIRWIASENCYKIYAACSSEGNNRVLDVKRGGQPITSGCNVQLWTETDPTSQQMRIVTAPETGLYYIQPISNTSVYLTVNGANDGDGALKGADDAGNVVMKSLQANSYYQKWLLVPKNDLPGSGTFYIRNKYSGRYLAVNGTQVVQQTKTGANSQKWSLVSRGNNYYNFQPLSASTSFMDVDNAADADGTNIKIHTDQIDYYGAQHFRFEASGDRCYTIRPMCSSTRVLSLSSNTTAENSQIKLATKNAALDRQQWYFEPVTTDPYAEMGWEYVFANPYTTPYRYLSTLFWEDEHRGLDIIEYGGGIDGAGIVSPTNGTVLNATLSDKGAGQYVTIRTTDSDPTTGNKLIVGFYHLKYSPSVSKGDSVVSGTLLGYVGNTGTSSGPHLHLFVTRDGTEKSGGNEQSHLVDPVCFFPNVEFYYHH